MEGQKSSDISSLDISLPQLHFSQWPHATVMEAPAEKGKERGTLLWLLISVLLCFKLIFIRVYLLYNIVLAFTVQQRESAMFIHITLL